MWPFIRANILTLVNRTCINSIVHSLPSITLNATEVLIALKPELTAELYLAVGHIQRKQASFYNSVHDPEKYLFL